MVAATHPHVTPTVNSDIRHYIVLILLINKADGNKVYNGAAIIKYMYIMRMFLL